MKIAILTVFLLLCAFSVTAQTPNDLIQDERFYNYVLADAKLSGQLETKLNIVIGILSTIGVGVLGIFFAIIKKKFLLPVVILGLCILIYSSAITPAECAGDCAPSSCRINADCGIGCSCDQFSFTCW